MQHSATDDIEATLMAELEQWLRNEVAPVARSGANWKAVINGRGLSDWSFVVEKHGGRRRCDDDQGSRDRA